MRKFFVSVALLILLGLAATWFMLSAGPGIRVTLINRCAQPLEELTVASEREAYSTAQVLPPGATTHLTIYPKQDSSVIVMFKISGKRFRTTVEGYVEQGYSGTVEAALDCNGNASTKNEIHVSGY